MKVKILLTAWAMFVFAPLVHAISIVADPSNVAVEREGDLFTLRVLLTDHAKTNDIFAAEFTLVYNPEYLKLTDSAGNETITVQSKIPWTGGYTGLVDPGKGIIEYSGLNLTSINCAENTLSDSFPVMLAELNFKALKQGKTEIRFDASVNPDEIFRSPTVVYLVSADSVCTGAVVPTPKNAAIQIGDFDPPVLSNVTVSKVTRSTAVITWTTNENSSSQIQYGNTEALGLATAIQDASPLVSSHTVTLTGLFPESTYYFRASSMDAAQNTGLSDIKTFKTNQVDETAPVITHDAVKYATEDVEQEILAAVKDDNDQITPAVFLYYKKSTESQYAKISMTHIGNGAFSGGIPKAAVSLDNVDYYLESEDNFLNKSASPASAPGTPYTIKVSSKFDVMAITGDVFSDSAKTKGIEGVKVRVIGLGVFALTNDAGNYNLSGLPVLKEDPFLYELEASKEGFITKRELYDFRFPPDDVDFVLSKSAVFSGTVYNSNTCQPVKLLKLTLKGALGDTVETFTDENGSFKISNFQLDTYSVNFSKAGYKTPPAAVEGCSRPSPVCTSPSVTFTEIATEQTQSCHYLADPKPVSIVTIKPRGIFTAPGDTVQFKASVATDDGENYINLVKNPSVTWSVSTASLGTITETGLFTAGGQNITGFVQAQSGTVTATADISVRRELSFRSVTNEIKAFNPRKLANGIEIRYELTQDPSLVTVSIYTMTGRKIRVIPGQKGADPGTGSAFWDGRDESGNEVYNGVYVYQITAQNKNGTAYSKPKALGILK